MKFRECLEKVIEPSLRSELNNELLSLRGPHEETILHYLCVENYVDSVHWLLQKGVDCNTVNSFGNTPLMDAIALDHEEIVALLLRMGADPNFQNEYGDTALHKAYECKSSEAIKNLLVGHGASEDLKNDLDLTPAES